MRKNVTRALGAAIFTGGLLMACTGMASADDLISLDEEVRVGDVLSVPIKVCGNAVNVLSNSDASCPPAQPQARAAADPLISAPITVCGNSVGVLGGGDATCGEPPSSQPSGSVISAPVTVCGNGVGVGGDANGDCGRTEVPEEPQPEEPQPEEPGPNPPNNGGGTLPPGTGLDQIGDHLGLGRGSNIGAPSAQASEPVKPLPNTGVDPLQMLLAAATLVASGAVARRAARRNA